MIDAMKTALLLLACLAPTSPALQDGEGGDLPSVLGDEPLTLVVVGYSSSLRWPAILQEMLDAHAGEPGRYLVASAAVPGAPLPKWLGRGGEAARERTFGRMARDWFEPGGERGDHPAPAVALCQMSLQGIYGPFRRGIRGPSDRERIERGADAFEELGEALAGLGVETVFLSTHIYKHALEPALHNERYALDALVDRKPRWLRRGPDLWTPTRALYPQGFRRDGAHPNELGARAMAVGWYRRLAGAAADPAIVAKYSEGLPPSEPAEPRPLRGGDV